MKGHPVVDLNQVLKGRKFQLWEYRVSHGHLLIRSPKFGGHLTNVDLIFAGVEYVSAPRFLNEIVLKQATQAEVERAMSDIGRSGGEREKGFVLETGSSRHLIVAAGVTVDENERDPFDSRLGSRKQEG